MFSLNIKRIAIAIIRILIGILFISTAVLKLLSIENFELYIYSFGIFNYVTVTILSRILLSTELLIGIFLIFRLFYHFTWRFTLILLLGFSAFLVYMYIFHTNENCHCFGDFIEMDALQSILKNIITIGLLLLVRKQEESHWRIKPYIISISIIVALFLPFVAFPNDALYSKIYSDSTQNRFNSEGLQKVMQTENLSKIIDSSQNVIVGLVSAKCKHCKAGNIKMQAILNQNNLDDNDFRNIIWCLNDTLLDTFKTQTKTERFYYQRMLPHKLININLGHFPTYLFIEKGTVIKALNYKELNEKEIVEFLKD